MTRRFALAFGTLAFLGAAPSFAQLAWKWVQPWTPPRAAFQSIVRGCTIPQPFPRAAADDWICGQTGPIVRVTWWGTLSHPAQGTRPFYVAIYSSAATACVPAQLLYQTCVIPDTRLYVGTDCQQRRVYRLSAPLPAPFTQQVGTHYWLQISEADAESIQPQVENFRWSGHRPIVQCRAVQFPPNFVTPLLDACDGQPDDLSFALQSRSLSGTIRIAGAAPVPAVLLMELLHPETGEVAERLCVEPDEDGHYSVSPESPAGPYLVQLSAGGIIAVRRTMVLMDDQDNSLSFFDVFVGDLNADGRNDLTDLALVLSTFGLP